MGADAKAVAEVVQKKNDEEVGSDGARAAEKSTDGGPVAEQPQDGSWNLADVPNEVALLLCIAPSDASDAVTDVQDAPALPLATTPALDVQDSPTPQQTVF